MTISPPFTPFSAFSVLCNSNHENFELLGVLMRPARLSRVSCRNIIDGFSSKRTNSRASSFCNKLLTLFPISFKQISFFLFPLLLIRFLLILLFTGTGGSIWTHWVWLVEAVLGTVLYWTGSGWSLEAAGSCLGRQNPGCWSGLGRACPGTSFPPPWGPLLAWPPHLQHAHTDTLVSRNNLVHCNKLF